MSTERMFEDDAYLKEIDVEVLEAGHEERGDFVLLDRTIFYPGGGGQPPDVGWVGEARVAEVRPVGSRLLHFLESPTPAGPATVRLDWARRYDHMQQHTAQHLITAAASDRFGWDTTAFHLGSNRCDIELDVPSLRREELVALEETVMQLVREARPVRVVRVSPAEYRGMAVRSRGLPDGHEGDVRLIEIEGIDRAACGGTHLASSAEVEAVRLLETESMRGGTRLHWVAGARVRRLLGSHEARSEALRKLLGVPDKELADSVRARLDRLRAASRRLEVVELLLADEVAAQLRAPGGPLFGAALRGSGPRFPARGSVADRRPGSRPFRVPHSRRKRGWRAVLHRASGRRSRPPGCRVGRGRETGRRSPRGGEAEVCTESSRAGRARSRAARRPSRPCATYSEVQVRVFIRKAPFEGGFWRHGVHP